MKKTIILLALLFLVACLDPTPPPVVITATPDVVTQVVTATPLVIITETLPVVTATPIDSPTPTSTEKPTASATATQTVTSVWPSMTPTDDPETVTPTMIAQETVDPSLPNRLPCGDMECAFTDEVICDDEYGCITQSVPPDWGAHYRDQPYTHEQKEALRICTEGQEVGCNDPGTLNGRPEYKQTEITTSEGGTTIPLYPNRVHDGLRAAQFFCFMRPCQGGLYFVADTTPGERCEAGAYVQSWSTSTGSELSQLLTQDDRDASMWRILVNKSGKTYSLLEENLSSRWYNFEDGHYDKFVKISFIFTANSRQSTIFFENLRIWGLANQDSYIDSAYLRCG
jgi:hypothetical protein